MTGEIIEFPELILLVSRKRDALSAEVAACLDRGAGALADQASLLAVGIEDQIAAMVPTTPAVQSRSCSSCAVSREILNGTSGPTRSLKI